MGPLSARRLPSALTCAWASRKQTNRVLLRWLKKTVSAPFGCTPPNFLFSYRDAIRPPFTLSRAPVTATPTAYAAGVRLSFLSALFALIRAGIRARLLLQTSRHSTPSFPILTANSRDSIERIVRFWKQTDPQKENAGWLGFLSPFFPTGKRPPHPAFPPFFSNLSCSLYSIFLSPNLLVGSCPQ